MWQGAIFSEEISSVQSLSRVWLFATPWTAACQASCPSPTPRVYLNSYPLSQWCHPTILILCCSLLLPPLIFPSIRVFSNESVTHIRWPKYWSFSFSISPSNEYSGLISFRIDWLDLLQMYNRISHEEVEEQVLTYITLEMSGTVNIKGKRNYT